MNVAEDSTSNNQSIFLSVTARHSARTLLAVDLGYLAYSKVQREHKKEVNALYSTVEASVNEGGEMVFDHAIQPFNEDSVLCLK